MSIQAIVLVTPETVVDWPSHGDTPGVGANYPLANLPPSLVMPGTREYNGLRAVHVNWAGDFTTLQEAMGPTSLIFIAAQDFHLTYDYNEEGEIIGGPHGVHVPVPVSFVDYLDDITIYNNEGDLVDTVRPSAGVPMHTFAGASQWVWA